MSGPNNQSRLPGSDARSRRAADALADPSVLIEDPLVIGRTGRITLGDMGAKAGWYPRWDGARWLAMPSLIPTPIKTAAYLAKPDEHVRCNPTGAGFPIYLPLSSTCIGARVMVKNASASANTITVTAQGPDLIDGATTLAFAAARAAREFVAVSGGWDVV